MHTIVITNYKGGSAKTTSTVSLAAALGERGFRVLVIDVDPQASATHWLGVDDPGRRLLDAYVGRRAVLDLVQPTSAPLVDLVPASQWLVATDRHHETDIALGIVRSIQRLPEEWDFVLVDCPPSQGYLAIAPLSACRHVLVPVEAHLLAVPGVEALLSTMAQVRERVNPALALDGILACRVNRTRHTRGVVDQLRERYPSHVLSTVVRENISLAEAPAWQLPITRYAPASAGAEDYRSVVSDLLERWSIADALGRSTSDDGLLVRAIGGFSSPSPEGTANAAPTDGAR